MAASMPMKFPWSPDKKHSDVERWICIYPAYINSKKSRQEGRRIAKNHCVENPTYVEIRDVLTVTNLRIGVENKQYPREKSKELNYRGRIRVQLKNDDGSPCNPQFKTRDNLLMFLGDRIPQLKTRHNKSSDSASSQSTQSGGNAAVGGNIGGGGVGGGGGGGGHKKGKGKRR